MKDRTPEEWLKDLQAPAPDPMARLRAKRAALAEFDKARASDNPIDPAFQDSDDSARLSRESTSGSPKMKRVMNRHWYAMAAGLGVVALGLTWVLPNLDRYSDEVTKPQLANASQPPSPQESTGATESAAAEPATASGDVRAMTGAPEPALDVAPPVEDERRQSELFTSPATTAPSAGAPAESEPVIVAGARIRELQAQEMKREAPVDAITAEDIGRFPDKSVPESLQRVAGNSRASAKMAVAPAPPPPSGIAGNLVTQPIYQDEGRDKFEHLDVNPVHLVSEAPVSTFSADVDTASYSFVRAQLMAGMLPQKDAVRAEEMINYFDYAWPAANSRSAPFKPTVVVTDSPWHKGQKLVHIGIKGYELDRGEAPDANLVMLLDVSGSMNAPNKLPLVVRSMELLLDSLKPSDTVGIVVYAGAAGTVLEPTPVREKSKILEALRSLRPGGSTAGAEGIERAYQLAEANFRKGGVNRILLATDGDFNVGIDSTEELKGFVERKREKGVYLSVLGFGQGNYRDELAQALAQNGNGVAAYIDTENEARKVLVREASSSLFTIAKDVKFQVEFNPATVAEYRLIGYETRALKTEDFNNDKIDAGDIGAGHTVTAIYEITPVGAENRMIGGSRYVKPPELKGNVNEYGFLQMRYKLPNQDTSTLITQPIAIESGKGSEAIQRDVGFSTAVAGFAQMLRGGQFTGKLSYDDIIKQALATRGEDPYGYRNEFVQLVRKAQTAR